MRAFTVAMLAVGLLVAGPVHAATEWVEVKTRHFMIYGKKSDRDLPRLATRLEELNRLLSRLHNVPEDEDEAERPLIVYVVPETEVQENAQSSNAAGFYAADKRNGYALVKRGRDAGMFDLGQEEVLFHEFAHHFMFAHSTAAYPAWYIEGFAEFFSTLEFKNDKSILFGKPPMYRAPQLVMADLYPIHKLLHETSAGLSLAEGDRYYGAAWLLTHYLFLNKDRNKEFQSYLADIARPEGARPIETYFEGGEKALEKELKAYLRSRLSAFSMALPEEGRAQPQIRPLRADENAMLLHEVRFRRHMRKEDATALARQVQATAATFPDSAYAQAFLAEVLQDLGEWAPAMAAADAAIKLEPDNSRAHVAKAEIIWGKARTESGELPYKAITAEIVAANRADLQDPYPLFLYFQLKRQQGALPQVAMDGLTKAYRQLPQYGSYRWALAGALAERKDYATAISIITPLANDPHGGRGALEAQRRRDQLIALRDGKAPPVQGSKGEKAAGAEVAGGKSVGK